MAEPLRHHRRLAARSPGAQAAEPTDGQRASPARSLRGRRGLLPRSGALAGAAATSSSFRTGSTWRCSARPGPDRRPCPGGPLPSTSAPSTSSASTSRWSANWPGSRPDLQIVLLGPDHLPAEVTASCDRVPNIRLLGAFPYDQIPAFMQHADVMIVPHLVNPFTESLDPDQGLRVPGRRPSDHCHAGGRLPRPRAPDRRRRPQPVRCRGGQGSGCRRAARAPEGVRTHPDPFVATESGDHGVADVSGATRGGDTVIPAHLLLPAGPRLATRATRATRPCPRMLPISPRTSYPRYPRLFRPEASVH